jgi:hypothetical protein
LHRQKVKAGATNSNHSAFRYDDDDDDDDRSYGFSSQESEFVPGGLMQHSPAQFPFCLTLRTETHLSGLQELEIPPFTEIYFCAEI